MASYVEASGPSTETWSREMPLETHRRALSSLNMVRLVLAVTSAPIVTACSAMRKKSLLRKGSPSPCR